MAKITNKSPLKNPPPSSTPLLQQLKTTHPVVISEQEKLGMIAAAAYRHADERGVKEFSQLDPLEDWTEAEIEVEEFLHSLALPRVG
ncbi:MAG: hypothetical protein J6Y94_08210 [Bacteriovoracaceae bacterium]|nr:hypothetical protein [Bacteriovoracaceae bacterium]